MTKKIFVSCLIIASLFYNCNVNSSRGQLIGDKGKKWYSKKPFGMTLIPGGSFTMGKSDDDLAGVQYAPVRTATVRAFYMDETEITNSKYRQYVNWVRDSIIRINLAEMADLESKEPGSGDIGEFAYLDTDPDNLTPYDKYIYDNYGDDARKINRDVELIFDASKYPDELYAEVMDNMYLPKEESYNGIRTWDVSQFKFSYTYMDIHEAANKRSIQRNQVIKTDEIEVYPDTTVWIRDFNYSYNEPMHNDYFWHDAYSNYPVVGVSWKQAKSFCEWRTLYHNSYQKKRKKHPVNKYRLPSEAEWEYAARGGLEGATYPWGNYYAYDDRGCFLANFKPLRGDYAADEALYTVEADAYEPNDYNLYNMAGNVSEWTNSSYDPSSYEVQSSINPNVSSYLNQRKVIRGGSWKDVAYFLEVSTRDYEYADSARSYIGFRTVQDYLGTDITGNGGK